MHPIFIFILQQLYQLFDPISGQERLERQSLSPAQVDKLEDRFMVLLFTVMSKSQYKLLSDHELEIATSGKYMLDFPIEVDPKKVKYFSALQCVQGLVI